MHIVHIGRAINFKNRFCTPFYKFDILLPKLAYCPDAKSSRFVSRETKNWGKHGIKAKILVFSSHLRGANVVGGSYHLMK